MEPTISSTKLSFWLRKCRVTHLWCLMKPIDNECAIFQNLIALFYCSTCWSNNLTIVLASCVLRAERSWWLVADNDWCNSARFTFVSEEWCHSSQRCYWMEVPSHSYSLLFECYGCWVKGQCSSLTQPHNKQDANQDSLAFVQHGLKPFQPSNHRFSRPLLLPLVVLISSIIFQTLVYVCRRQLIYLPRCRGDGTALRF